MRDVIAHTNRKASIWIARICFAPAALEMLFLIPGLAHLVAISVRHGVRSDFATPIAFGAFYVVGGGLGIRASNQIAKGQIPADIVAAPSTHVAAQLATGVAAFLLSPSPMAHWSAWQEWPESAVYLVPMRVLPLLGALYFVFIWRRYGRR